MAQFCICEISAGSISVLSESILGDRLIVPLQACSSYSAYIGTHCRDPLLFPSPLGGGEKEGEKATLKFLMQYLLKNKSDDCLLFTT